MTMEGEGAWRGLKAAFKRLFLKKKSEPLTTRGSSTSSSRNSSFRSALDGDDNASFVKDTPRPTPESLRRARVVTDTVSRFKAVQDPLRHPPFTPGAVRRTLVPVPAPQPLLEEVPYLQRRKPRESRSLSPHHLYHVGTQGRDSVPIKPIIKKIDEDASCSGEERSRPKNRVTIDLRDSPSPSPQVPIRSCSEERSRPSETNLEPGISSCIAEQRLNTLFLDRGYHVKALISNKALDDRIMHNIRRREKIAIMMRNEAATAAGYTKTITTVDELSTLNQTKKPRPKTLPTGPGTIDPIRLQHVLGLVSRVWTKRDIPPSQRMPSNRVADFARIEFVNDCLRAHNEYRELHGTPPLVLCEKLCEESQIWAAHLAEMGTIQYSIADGRGENIMTTATGRGGLTGEGVTKAWYEKGRKYKYNMPDTADLAYAGSFSQVIWKSTKKLGVGMARDEDGRIFAVARYVPKGNVPGRIKANVPPLLQINPFDLPTYSKTREEANLDVQTAMIAPEVCLSVAKDYAIVTRALENNPKMAAAHAKITGVRSRRKRKVKETKKQQPKARTASSLCPNGRIIPICCGPPTLPAATPPTSVRNPKETLKVLSPLSLATESAYKNLTKNQNLTQASSSSSCSQQKHNDTDIFAGSRLEFRTNYNYRPEISQIGSVGQMCSSNNLNYSVKYNDRPQKVNVLPIRTDSLNNPGTLALS